MLYEIDRQEHYIKTRKSSLINIVYSALGIGIVSISIFLTINVQWAPQYKKIADILLIFFGWIGCGISTYYLTNFIIQQRKQKYNL
jgi:hypothetical protein